MLTCRARGGQRLIRLFCICAGHACKYYSVPGKRPLLGKHPCNCLGCSNGKCLLPGKHPGNVSQDNYSKLIKTYPGIQYCHNLSKFNSRLKFLLLCSSAVDGSEDSLKFCGIRVLTVMTKPTSLAWPTLACRRSRSFL